MKKKRKRLQDLNGCELKKGQQRMTPGVPVLATHMPETVAPMYRHPDLNPVTLTGLIDALRLNEIPFTYEMDGQYCCDISAGGFKAEINPFDAAEVLSFFRAVVCPS